MSIFNGFLGPSVRSLVKKGDELAEKRNWGDAKLIYERALAKAERRPNGDGFDRERLRKKIESMICALARQHQQSAVNYLDGGYAQEAREMFHLALSILRDNDMKRHTDLQKEIETQLDDLENKLDRLTEAELNETPIYDSQASEETEGFEVPAQFDDFDTLCHTLPDEMRDAYLSYDEDFRFGYMALNRGDFQTASEYLRGALDAQKDQDTAIALELATAYLNLGRLDEAEELLERFRQTHPDNELVYQLLCDIHWQRASFARADHLLAQLPQSLGALPSMVLLKGENLLRAGQIKSARDFYESFMDAQGWDEAIAGRLADIQEKLDEPQKAKAIYREIIDHSRNCGCRVDPLVRSRYAEICFAAGELTAEVLEHYLRLTVEDTEHSALYFDRISRIYAAQGFAAEADRFKSLSGRASAS